MTTITTAISPGFRRGRYEKLSHYDDHHFRFWNEKEHPLVICTDDKGVFNCDLNSEYLLYHENMGISLEDLQTLAKNAVEYSFFSESEKQDILKQF